MRRIFYSLITMFIFLSSIHASANEIDDFDFKNYVYDDEGTPVFIKIYIKSPKTESSNENKSGTPLFQEQDDLQQILSRMAQDDQRGSYIVVPITKKKKIKDDDDEDKDESTWECPYCGQINRASSDYCERRGCVLYRYR